MPVNFTTLLYLLNCKVAKSTHAKFSITYRRVVCYIV